MVAASLHWRRPALTPTLPHVCPSLAPSLSRPPAALTHLDSLAPRTVTHWLWPALSPAHPLPPCCPTPSLPASAPPPPAALTWLKGMMPLGSCSPRLCGRFRCKSNTAGATAPAAAAWPSVLLLLSCCGVLQALLMSCAAAFRPILWSMCLRVCACRQGGTFAVRCEGRGYQQAGALCCCLQPHNVV